MPAPCRHDPPKPRCHLCFQFATDETANRRWGGDGLARKPTAEEKEWQRALFRTPTRLAFRSFCRYLGQKTGGVRNCESGCQGRVRLKLFDCQHLLHTTPTTLLACKECPDCTPTGFGR